MLSLEFPHPRPAPLSRLADEESGFTLLELIIVIFVLGILTAIAVPTFISLQARADKGAAMTNVRAVTSDVEAYYADNGTFDGISAAVLQANYDKSIEVALVQIVSVGGTSFMICSKSHGYFGYKLGPAAVISASSARPSGCTL